MGNQVFILIVNVLLYLIALCFYKRKHHCFDPYTILIALYTFVAICSLLFYLLEPTNWKLTLWPFIYFFVICLIFFKPFISNSIIHNREISNSSVKYLKIFSVIFIILALISIINYLPDAVGNILSGDWSDIRTSLYHDETLIVDRSIGAKFINLSTHFRIAATVVCFHFLSIKNKVPKILSWTLWIAIILLPISLAIKTASRGALWDLFLLLVVCYLLFKGKYSQSIKHRFKVFAIAFVVITLFYSAAVTISRFGSENEYTSLLSYFGQSMLVFNYGVVDTIHSYGYGNVWSGGRFANWFGIGNLISDKFDPDSLFGTHFGVSFYTYVGAWYLDFGLFGTIIVAIIISFLLNKFFRRHQQKGLSSIYIYVYFITYLITGVFVMPYGYGIDWMLWVPVNYLILLFVERKKLIQ